MWASNRSRRHERRQTSDQRERKHEMDNKSRQGMQSMSTAAVVGVCPVQARHFLSLSRAVQVSRVARE